MEIELSQNFSGTELHANTVQPFKLVPKWPWFLLAVHVGRMLRVTPSEGACGIDVMLISMDLLKYHGLKIGSKM